jgi:hypothetical protein
LRTSSRDAFPELAVLATLAALAMLAALTMLSMLAKLAKLSLLGLRSSSTMNRSASAVPSPSVNAELKFTKEQGFRMFRDFLLQISFADTCDGDLDNEDSSWI